MGQAVDSWTATRSVSAHTIHSPTTTATMPPSCGWGLLVHFQKRITINTASSGTTFWGNLPARQVHAFHLVFPVANHMVIEELATVVGVDFVHGKRQTL